MNNIYSLIITLNVPSREIRNVTFRKGNVTLRLGNVIVFGAPKGETSTSRFSWPWDPTCHRAGSLMLSISTINYH